MMVVSLYCVCCITLPHCHFSKKKQEMSIPLLSVLDTLIQQQLLGPLATTNVSNELIGNEYTDLDSKDPRYPLFVSKLFLT
jgi:hypothetical protein